MKQIDNRSQRKALKAYEYYFKNVFKLNNFESFFAKSFKIRKWKVNPSAI